MMKSLSLASSRRNKPQPLMVDLPTLVFLYCLLLILELQHIRKPTVFAAALLLLFPSLRSWAPDKAFSTWSRMVGWTATPQ